MAKKTTEDRMVKDIMDLLNEYGKDVYDVLEDSVEETAKIAEKKLHVAGKFKGRGKFKKGWKTKIDKSGRHIEAHVYNAKLPSLTHLLEFGHVIVRGKRKGQRTTAFNFIAPINDEVQSDLVRKIERKLR